MRQRDLLAKMTEALLSAAETAAEANLGHSSAVVVLRTKGNVLVARQTLIPRRDGDDVSYHTMARAMALATSGLAAKADTGELSTGLAATGGWIYRSDEDAKKRWEICVAVVDGPEQGLEVMDVARSIGEDLTAKLAEGFK